MAGSTLILITGGNQGLGYYAALQMSATGRYHVLLGARDTTKAEKAIQTITDDRSVKADANNVEPIQIDVTDDSSIMAAAKTVEQKYGKLDILLNNAGIAQAQDGKVEDGSLRKAYMTHYDTNLFGAAATTEAFLPLLRKGTNKRIAFTSSGLSSLEWAATKDANFSGAMYPIYRSTKTAMSMIMLYYGRKLDAEGFIVSAADPGYCSTDLNAYNGMKDPRDGAKVLIRACEAAKDDCHNAVIDETSKEPW